MPKDKLVSIGKSVKRIDAPGKVTGETPYPGDFDFEDQLWLAIKYSERSHARVKAIDTSQASQLAGVVAVFTAKDVPVNEYGLTMKDQPVLCGPGSSIAGSDKVRCYMDHVAVVVAENQEIALAAVDLIMVDYEDLPAVYDAELAMADGQALLHEDTPNNIISHFKIRKGDMEAGWEQADVVVEEVYETTWQEHAFLQPEAGLSYIDEEGRVTVIVAGQWTHEDQEQIYHALGLKPEQVRVIYPAIGGAFGGREDMSVQIVLALAAWKLKRPIKTVWDREESMRGHHKRHPIKVYARWGAKRNGKIVAIESKVIGDGGAYNYTSNKVMGNANLMVSGAYDVANIHIDTYAVYTNNIPSGAFRGFGSPQALFAAEGQINRLAERLDMDPIQIRLINCIREGSLLSVGTPISKGCSMPEVISSCANESFWTEKGQDSFERNGAGRSQSTHLRRGIGFACGYKNVGFSFGAPEECWATVELRGASEIEEVIVYHAGADVGQGAHTVFAQMAADALSLPIEMIRVVGSDTATSQSSGSASASRLTFMAGNSIRGAAEKALVEWRQENRPARGVYQYRPPRTTALDPETGKSEPNFAYGYVAEAVEIEVDIDTGQIHVLKVVCANDVGQAINPQQVQGQIEGAVIQALGYSLTEEIHSREGRILNPHFSTYIIPTVLDIPIEVKSVILEYPDPIGPWGARGMAEMPFLPLLPAIAAAIHDATGVWMDSQPFTPAKLVHKLREHGIGGF